VFFQFLAFAIMVVIRDCDGEGRVIPPSCDLEKNQLRRDCLRHATRFNGVIDWEVYHLVLDANDLPKSYTNKPND